MTLPPPKVCDRIRKLFAQMGSSGKDAEVARDKLNQLLVEHGLSWNDLLVILAATAAADTCDDMNASAAAAGV
jgi:triphosphoribosyl-dephospho-CoA synthetase